MGEGDGSDKEAKWLIDSLILSAAWKRNLHGWKVELEVLYREKKCSPGHKPDAAVCASNVSRSPHYPQDVALPATL